MGTFIVSLLFLSLSLSLQHNNNKQQQQQATVRWVHMHNMDDMMTRRLGVKFRLHPLALEDCTVPVVDAMSLEQRPKAEKFKEHLFFVIPRVRLVYETRTRKKRNVVQMTNAARSMFWFVCCFPLFLFSCFTRCCKSCHRICLPPSSRERRRRRGGHRRSRTNSRIRLDSVPYTVLLDDEVTLNGLEEGRPHVNDEEHDHNKKKKKHTTTSQKKKNKTNNTSLTQEETEEEEENLVEIIKLSQLSMFCIGNHTMLTVRQLKTCIYLLYPEPRKQQIHHQQNKNFFFFFK